MTKKEMYQKMDEAFKEGITTVNITFNGEKFYFESNGEKFYFEINGECYEFTEGNKRKKNTK